MQSDIENYSKEFRELQEQLKQVQPYRNLMVLVTFQCNDVMVVKVKADLTES